MGETEPDTTRPSTLDVSIGRIAATTITFEQYLAGASVVEDFQPNPKVVPAHVNRDLNGPSVYVDGFDPRLPYDGGHIIGQPYVR